MRIRSSLMIAPLLGLVACNSEPSPRDSAQKIAVRSAEQDRLHRLNEMDLAIALKRAIHASGYRCKRVESAGFVAKHKNLDMWMAKCSEGRDWAVFAGPDGSAQVRDCVDVPRFGLPECKVSNGPKAATS